MESMDKVHMLACKRFLDVPMRTPNTMTYGELARCPLFVNSYCRCITYWFRLLRMERDIIPTQAYQLLLLMDENEKKCYAKEMKKIFVVQVVLFQCMVKSRS